MTIIRKSNSFPRNICDRGRLFGDDQVRLTPAGGPSSLLMKWSRTQVAPAQTVRKAPGRRREPSMRAIRLSPRPRYHSDGAARSARWSRSESGKGATG
jgi:hypothetical protein